MARRVCQTAAAGRAILFGDDAPGRPHNIDNPHNVMGLQSFFKDDIDMAGSQKGVVVTVTAIG